MKTNVLFALMLVTLLFFDSMAQENGKRFGFELNSGVSMATQKMGDNFLNPGFGYEGIFHYRFLSNLGVYGGWGWNRFGADESFAGDDVCFEETGYVLGLQFSHPFGKSPVSWYLRGGGLYSHIETENSDGEVFNNTGHGMGWQLAGGIDVPMGKNWSFTPGVKFNALSRDSEFEDISRTLDYNYLSLRVGFVKRF